MYSKCISCPKLGFSCEGPNFVAMSATELLEWCKLRKAKLGLSNAKLAEQSGLPKGTIDRLFAGEHFDFRFETIRPMIRVLVGGTWNGDSCPDPEPETERADAEALKKLSEENAKIRDYIDHMEQKHQAELENWKEEAQRKIDFLKEQLKISQATEKARRKTVAILGVTLVITLVVIIAALIIDRLNPDVGFFWREALGFISNVNTNGNTNLLMKWGL